jgi:hypothetical protein
MLTTHFEVPRALFLIYEPGSGHLAAAASVSHSAGYWAYSTVALKVAHLAERWDLKTVPVKVDLTAGRTDETMAVAKVATKAPMSAAHWDDHWVVKKVVRMGYL